MPFSGIRYFEIDPRIIVLRVHPIISHKVSLCSFFSQDIPVICPLNLEFMARDKFESGPSEPQPVRQKVGMGLFLNHPSTCVCSPNYSVKVLQKPFLLSLYKDHRKPLLHVRKARRTCFINILVLYTKGGLFSFYFYFFSSLALWLLWVCGSCGFTMLYLSIYLSNLT